MPMQLAGELTSDLVTARGLNTIRREMNRDTGRYVVDTILSVKTTRSAYYEYPGIVNPRTPAYARRKRAQVGHDIPNVLTGRTREFVPANARVTATANGGRVYLRGPHPWREAQRQEWEAISARQRDRMAKRQERFFAAAIEKPEHRRRRRVRDAQGRFI